MEEYEVEQIVIFYWSVKAQSKKEAIEIADDMGEIGSTSSKYTPKTAYLKRTKK